MDGVIDFFTREMLPSTPTTVDSTTEAIAFLENLAKLPISQIIDIYQSSPKEIRDAIDMHYKGISEISNKNLTENKYNMEMDRKKNISSSGDGNEPFEGRLTALEIHFGYIQKDFAEIKESLKKLPELLLENRKWGVGIAIALFAALCAVFFGVFQLEDKYVDSRIDYKVLEHQQKVDDQFKEIDNKFKTILEKLPPQKAAPKL